MNMPDDSGQYTIPAEFAQSYGESTKKFVVVVSGLPAIDGNDNNYEYKTKDGEGEYLTSLGSDGKVNILVTGIASNDSNFIFHIQRKTGTEENYTDVTENLPKAKDATGKAHTFTNVNGVFTVPAVFAVPVGDDGKYHHIKVDHLPQKCIKGDYVYRVVVVDNGNNTPIQSTYEDGNKVVGGIVKLNLKQASIAVDLTPRRLRKPGKRNGAGFF